MFARRLFPSGILISGICLLLYHLVPARAEPAAQGTVYQIDTNSSRVFVHVGSATALGHPHGVEGQLKSGKLSFGAGGELVFDMATFTADTEESHKRVGLEREKTSASDAKKATATMRGSEVLNVPRFPTATFHITAVKALDGQAAGAPGIYLIDGTFNLHGTDRTIQIKAQLQPAQQQGTVKLTGSFKIKQTDYGIKPYSMFAGVIKVADELQISGDLLLTPAQ
jgi:polyisoprenoid-binding protein YceI